MNNSADDDMKFDMPDIPDTGLNDREMKHQLIAQKLVDAQIPGFQAEFDPEEAGLLGAFKEDTLSEVEALDSSIDQPESTDGGQ
ncbi:hypothetical protein SAMN05216326_1703 [Nitrosomonas marina]|uniref:Conjugal transfer protein TraD n=1 Tax=Nitrosomonas marina TaxID=917 RepID=A0A1I0GFN5_9PROT|nr:hypothetical protein [Nitrosomonas marina]SET69780.1 hypothetical protein SAMN05216326_1703 [Nitrosomonas marina]